MPFRHAAPAQPAGTVILPIPPPPPDNTVNVNIISFELDSEIIRDGESATLSWTVENATSCSIDQGIGTVDPEAGSVAVSPDTDTVYTLECLQTGDSDAAEAELTVYPAAGTFDNAIQEGGTGGDGLYEMAVHTNGSLYVSGAYGTSDSIWGEPPSQTTLSASGANSNGVFAKYDSSLNLAWAKRLKNVVATNLSFLGNGQVVISGTTAGDAEFNPGELNSIPLTNTGYNPFVAVADSDGTVLWARSATGGSSVGAGTNDSARLSDNSILLIGSFSGSLTFAQGTPGQVTITATGVASGFIARYESDGDFLWAKRITAGGTGKVYPAAVSVNADDTFVIGGAISESAIFGPGEANATTLTATPAPGFGYNAFIAKYNANGTLAWAKQATSGANSVIYDMSRMAGGDLIVSGHFGFSPSYLSVTIGPGSTSPVIFTGSNHDQHAWMGRFSASGELNWAKRSSSGTASIWRNTLSSGEDEVFSMGSCSGGTVFGDGEAGEMAIPGETTSVFSCFTRFSSSNGLLQDGFAFPKSSNSSPSFAIFDAYRMAYGGNLGETTIFGEGSNQKTIVPAGGDAFIATYWK